VSNVPNFARLRRAVGATANIAMVTIAATK
jgi:hypothetical protein